ncbi:hypothetical protein PV327_011296 [Microctonus hyperodae]|uniref:Uncharacterized protein n=1 Tax=Microctonus hyperodae TaxID=165561 RepID=A0AA39EZV5_MICHY|nr:hypothetical protein PV327_011296 [Microctonus hyperodae]
METKQFMKRKLSLNNSSSTTLIHVESIVCNYNLNNITPSKIEFEKWQEIIDEEIKYNIVNSICHEIIQLAIDEAYKYYLNRIKYSFVIDCAHQAWVQMKLIYQMTAAILPLISSTLSSSHEIYCQRRIVTKDNPSTCNDWCLNVLSIGIK